jgi:glycosyltransferase involved in cell wall biosynthesis
MIELAPAGSSSSSENAGQDVRQLRIAIVTPEHWSRVMGGAEYQTMLLADLLHRKHDAEICFFVARAGKQANFDSHRVVCVGRDGFLSRYGNFWDVFRLSRALRKFAPDVIYQRVGCSYTGVVARYSKKRGIDCIWHVANEADTDPAPSLLRAFRKPHFVLERLLFDFGRRRMARIVVQSERQARLLRDNLGLDAYRMIRNFHPVPREVGEKDDTFTVCWVANLKPIKNPELLFEIAGQLNDLENVRFIMVGRPYTDKRLQQAFDRKLSEHGNVDYIDGLSQEDVNSLLARSQLLVNTSPREGFSNVFIQAWLRRVPVFTLGVNPDGLLDDGSLGAAFDSPEALAEKIRYMTQAPDRLEAMGERCREVAAKMFSMDNADELGELIVKSASAAIARREQETVA